MNILVTGCNGQLGTELRNRSVRFPHYNWVFADIVSPNGDNLILDITDEAAVHSLVAEHHIDLIVNCAAYTNVDRAEEDEAAAERLNADAVRILGAMPVRMIHISTDYVFAGEGWIPCREDDPVAPRTAYGRTKLHGEEQLLAVNPEAVIIRTAWLYSPYGNNFVKTMLKYGKERDKLTVVYDQVGTPTYAGDLAEAILTVIADTEWKPGIYHFTNEGVCSWYDFTIEILRQAGVNCTVEPILSSQYQYKTPRPHYSVLDKAKFKAAFNANIPYWTDGLSRCLKAMNELPK